MVSEIFWKPQKYKLELKDMHVAKVFPADFDGSLWQIDTQTNDRPYVIDPPYTECVLTADGSIFVGTNFRGLN